MLLYFVLEFIQYMGGRLKNIILVDIGNLPRKKNTLIFLLPSMLFVCMHIPPCKAVLLLCCFAIVTHLIYVQRLRKYNFVGIGDPPKNNHPIFFANQRIIAYACTYLQVCWLLYSATAGVPCLLLHYLCAKVKKTQFLYTMGTYLTNKTPYFFCYPAHYLCMYAHSPTFM